jgi:GDP-L-fucose synthase
MKILVTGGNGMVGQHLKTIRSDLSIFSSQDWDLRNYKDANKIISQTKPDIIVHLAAKVGGIKAHIENPVEYFEDNLLINTNTLKASYNNKIKRFIGVLSTCAYPDVIDHYPMVEEDLHKGPPAPTNFGYGYAKRCLAVQIEAYNKQYKTKYQYLIPSNLYSEYENKNEKNSHFLNALVEKIIKSEQEGKKEITLWGTGKPLRQFTYALDLAKIISYIIDKDIIESFNISCPDNYSIHEMATIALAALGHEDWKINYIHPELDGQYRKDVNIEKMKSSIKDNQITNFTPLENGIKIIYDTISKRHN